MQAFRMILLGLILSGAAVLSLSAAAEEANPALLAAALTHAQASLQDGLKASEREGKPISAKFEIEHDALQLSVYTLKGSDFMEVVADTKTGAVAKSEKITDADDLKDAEAQKAAMATAKTSLLAATETAVKDNKGFRAVSVFPQLRNGHPVAEVTLLQGANSKKVVEKLD
jgi:uncharacterized protein YicC (UPF0701 family)